MTAAPSPGIMSDVVHASQTLIGRDEELDELEQLLTAATARSHVLLAGDAGVGKTRLLQELCARTRSAGEQAYVGHCLDLGESALPYLPFSELLDRIAGDLPEIVEEVGRDYPDLSRLQSVRRLLGAQGHAGGDVDRMQLFAGVHALLETLAARAPLLVVIEDVHWADQSTRELLTFLLTRPLTGPVSIVASYRTDDLHRRHPLRGVIAELLRLPMVALVELGPLPAAALAEILSNAANAPFPLSAATLNSLVERAEGNAYYAEELLTASSCADGADGTLPTGLAELLLSRVERVSDAAQQVLRAAAVAGGGQQFHLRPDDHQGDNADLGREVDHQTDRLAESAATGQFVAAEGVNPAVLGREQQLVGRLGVEDRCQRIALAKATGKDELARRLEGEIRS